MEIRLKLNGSLISFAQKHDRGLREAISLAPQLLPGGRERLFQPLTVSTVSAHR